MLAAIAAGKHGYCEKPLAPLAQDALEMAQAAEAAGVKTQVGFNYLMNPMLRVAPDTPSRQNGSCEIASVSRDDSRPSPECSP